MSDKQRATRLAANRELVQMLAWIVENGADLRFGQLLLNYGFVKTEIVAGNIYWVDEYYLESDKLLQRAKEGSQ